MGFTPRSCGPTMTHSCRSESPLPARRALAVSEAAELVRAAQGAHLARAVSKETGRRGRTAAPPCSGIRRSLWRAAVAGGGFRVGHEAASPGHLTRDRT